MNLIQGQCCGENRYWGGSIKNICIENIHANNAEIPAILTGYETTKNDGSVVTETT